MRELVHRLRQAGCFAEVAAGYLRCEPSIEDVVARIECGRIRIYPMFLSDGYYVREAIPRRLAIVEGIDARGRKISIDPPLGLHPELPRVLASAAAAAAERRGILPKSANLLLVAHGSSKTPHSAEVANLIKDSVAKDLAFASVAVAFLEEEPLFSAALVQSARPLLVLGLLAGGGMHATDDVQAAVNDLGDPQVINVAQLGGYASIIELVVADLCKSRQSATPDRA